jgi:hypothetical protein
MDNFIYSEVFRGLVGNNCDVSDILHIYFLSAKVVKNLEDGSMKIQD